MKPPSFELTLNLVEGHEPHDGATAVPVVLCVRSSTPKVISTKVDVFALFLLLLPEQEESKNYGYARTAWFPSEDTIEISASKPLFLIRDLMEFEEGRVLVAGTYALEATALVSEQVNDRFVRHELKGRREILVMPRATVAASR